MFTGLSYCVTSFIALLGFLSPFPYTFNFVEKTQKDHELRCHLNINVYELVYLLSYDLSVRRYSTGCKQRNYLRHYNFCDANPDPLHKLGYEFLDFPVLFSS